MAPAPMTRMRGGCRLIPWHTERARFRERDGEDEDHDAERHSSNGTNDLRDNPAGK